MFGAAEINNLTRYLVEKTAVIKLQQHSGSLHKDALAIQNEVNVSGLV